MRSKLKVYSVFFGIVFIAALLGSIATQSGIHGWYERLRLPAWKPAKDVFAPIWTILYIMIALSGALIYLGPHRKERKNALVFWGISLLLNTFWSFAFFVFKSPILAGIDITLLWISLLLTIFYAYQENKVAAVLLFPYIIWLSFAAVLNWTIVHLN